MQLISPEFLEASNFYEKLSQDSHSRVLQLLSTFVPDQSKYEDFQTSPTHEVLVSYLIGFVRHNPLFSHEEINGVKSMDTINKAVRYLRTESGMPPYYLNSVFKENIGRAPERDRPGVPLGKKYEDVVRAPGEQRKPKSH